MAVSALATHPHVERWLSIMDRKDHPLWHRLAAGTLPRAALRTHFEQEYVAYVRDFPVLLARVLGQGPPADVAAALAANIYEEQVGGISGTQAHPQLFLRQMAALGWDPAAFESVAPLPATGAYRAVLDDATANADWRVGFAVMCVFVEGSSKERHAVGLTQTPLLPPDVDTAIHNHPLVLHYGVAPEQMVLTRAHFMVEGGHRDDAWEAVTRHVLTTADADKVTRALERALVSWHGYRDGVAAAVAAV